MKCAPAQCSPHTVHINSFRKYNLFDYNGVLTIHGNLVTAFVLNVMRFPIQMKRVPTHFHLLDTYYIGYRLFMLLLAARYSLSTLIGFDKIAE